MSNDASSSSAVSSRPFPTQRFSWSELEDIILVQNDLARLRRCREDQEVYDEYMSNVVCKQYKSVMDFILCTKLDMETKLDPDSGLKYAYPPLNQITTVRKKLVRNDFPYYFEKDVDHWILWKLGGEAITPLEIDQAKETLRRDLGNVVDDMHWINPSSLKSIPEIDHVHILCRRSGGEAT